jgi:hypothetical protein
LQTWANSNVLRQHAAVLVSGNGFRVTVSGDGVSSNGYAWGNPNPFCEYIGLLAFCAVARLVLLLISLICSLCVCSLCTNPEHPTGCTGPPNGGLNNRNNVNITDKLQLFAVDRWVDAVPSTVTDTTTDHPAAAAAAAAAAAPAAAAADVSQPRASWKDREATRGSGPPPLPRSRAEALRLDAPSAVKSFHAMAAHRRPSNVLKHPETSTGVVWTRPKPS